MRHLYHFHRKIHISAVCRAVNASPCYIHDLYIQNVSRRGFLPNINNKEDTNRWKNIHLCGCLSLRWPRLLLMNSQFWRSICKKLLKQGLFWHLSYSKPLCDCFFCNRCLRSTTNVIHCFLLFQLLNGCISQNKFIFQLTDRIYGYLRLWFRQRCRYGKNRWNRSPGFWKDNQTECILCR